MLERNNLPAGEETQEEKNRSVESESAENSSVAEFEEVVCENETDEKAVSSNDEVKDPEKEKKKKIRKKILGYILFVAISAAVILGMILFEDRSGDPVSGKEALRLLAEHPFYTAYAVLSYFVIVAADVLVFVVLTRKLKTNCSFAACVGASFLGRYFDRVTPWSSGGEPFQVVYLHKKGLSSGDSCAVTMSRHIIRFFSVAVAVIIILASSGIVTNPYVMAAAIASVFAGLIIPSFMLICAFKPKVGRKISDGVIGLLCKMKIVKHREKAEEKVNKNVTQFLTGVKYLSVNKSVIVVIALGALIEMFANNSVPFFVMRALGVSDVAYWETLVLCLFVNYASSFAPTPGGAGIAELSFYAIFAAHIDGGILFWAVLFWRIAVFYIPVFIGFVLQVISAVKAIIKIKRA